MKNFPNKPQPVAYRIKDWCAAVGVGNTTFHKLVKEKRVRTAKCGKITLVLTSPVDFVASLGA